MNIAKKPKLKAYDKDGNLVVETLFKNDIDTNDGVVKFIQRIESKEVDGKISYELLEFPEEVGINLEPIVVYPQGTIFSEEEQQIYSRKMQDIIDDITRNMAIESLSKMFCRE